MFKHLKYASASKTDITLSNSENDRRTDINKIPLRTPWMNSGVKEYSEKNMFFLKIVQNRYVN